MLDGEHCMHSWLTTGPPARLQLLVVHWCAILSGLCIHLYCYSLCVIDAQSTFAGLGQLADRCLTPCMSAA